MTLPEPAPAIGTAHRRRLREVWRSAGWPYQDVLEAELLAAGLLARQRDAAGRDTVHVTDAGVAELARTLNRNRAVRDAHEALVARVAREMQRAGRIVWRGLSLRARVGEVTTDGADDAAASAVEAPSFEDALSPPPTVSDDGRWVIAMPDVYSIRHTTVEDYAEPVVHEIKVHRSDLLSDLRQPNKGAAYAALASQCWYVLRAGIAEPGEIPEAYGVMLAHDSHLEVARPAPRRAQRVPFAVWMALARADAERPPEDDPQARLG